VKDPQAVETPLGLSYTELMGLRYSPEALDATAADKDNVIMVSAGGNDVDLSAGMGWVDPRLTLEAVAMLAAADDAAAVQLLSEIAATGEERNTIVVTAGETRRAGRGERWQPSRGDTAEQKAQKAAARRFDEEIQKRIATGEYTEKTVAFGQSYQDAIMAFAASEYAEHGTINGAKFEQYVNTLLKDAEGFSGGDRWSQSLSSVAGGLTRLLKNKEALPSTIVTYTQREQNSTYAQILGKFVMSEGGTAFLHYVNEASFGIVAGLDKNDALGITRAANPRAAAIGENIGTVRDIATGTVALKGTIKLGSKYTDDVVEVGFDAAEPGGLNLFKWGSDTTTKAGGWKDGDFMLYLPDKGSPKANWAQNAGRIREQMGQGKPIFDSYRDPVTGLQIPSKGFLGAERNLLETRGWIYNPATGAYYPPVP
jgi:hypothetical protein